MLVSHFYVGRQWSYPIIWPSSSRELQVVISFRLPAKIASRVQQTYAIRCTTRCILHRWTKKAQWSHASYLLLGVAQSYAWHRQWTCAEACAGDVLKPWFTHAWSLSTVSVNACLHMREIRFLDIPWIAVMFAHARNSNSCDVRACAKFNSCELVGVVGVILRMHEVHQPLLPYIPLDLPICHKRNSERGVVQLENERGPFLPLNHLQVQVWSHLEWRSIIQMLCSTLTLVLPEKWT